MATLPDIVLEVRDSLVDHLGDGIALVILYGSEARGEAHQDSDVDLMVVTRGNDQQLSDAVRDVIYSVMWRRNFDRLVSVYVVSQGDYEAQVRRGWSFITSVRRDGVVLWKAA